MTAPDILAFIPLAVLTNTVFPMPFEPVLLWFAGRAEAGEGWILAGVGSACAGVAAVVDARIVGAVGWRWRDRKGLGRPLPRAGVRFYLTAFLVALLPIPFATIRLTLLQVRPRLALYAVTVAAARLPRYVATVQLWRSLAPPGWVAVTLVLAAIGYMLVAARRP